MQWQPRIAAGLSLASVSVTACVVLLSTILHLSPPLPTALCVAPPRSSAFSQTIDLDKSGSIDLKELMAALKMVDKTATEEQVSKRITKYDGDKDGKVNLEEYEKLVYRCAPARSTPARSAQPNPHYHQDTPHTTPHRTEHSD